MNDLIDYQTKIEQYQENVFQSEDLANLQIEITGKSSGTPRYYKRHGRGDVVTAERELKSLMASKQNYLKENVNRTNNCKFLYAKKRKYRDM